VTHVRELAQDYMPGLKASFDVTLNDMRVDCIHLPKETMEKTRIRWAPRVRRDKVKRLYESDAQGRLDLDLLDEVGYGIYARCQEMFEVRDAINGAVRCRGCRRTTLPRQRYVQVEDSWVPNKAQVLTCPECGWRITWQDYFDSYNGNCLIVGAALGPLSDFVARWPVARTAAQKMQTIDTLIHAFHVNRGLDGRPVGENVITGTRAQVIALLNDLAYGDTSLASLERRAEWRERLDGPMRQFRRAHDWYEIRAMARELGIPAPADTDDRKSVIEEILRRRAKGEGDMP
jgi:hypothetical protein